MSDWDNSQLIRVVQCGTATILKWLTQTTSFNGMRLSHAKLWHQENAVTAWDRHQAFRLKVFNLKDLNCNLFIGRTSTNQNLILEHFEHQPWASSLRRSLTSLGVGPSGTSGLPTFGGRPFLRRLPFAPSPINCRSELGGRPLRPSIAKIRGMTSSSFNKLHCKPYREMKNTQKKTKTGWLGEQTLETIMTYIRLCDKATA